MQEMASSSLQTLTGSCPGHSSARSPCKAGEGAAASARGEEKVGGQRLGARVHHNVT